ncbi:hypothetical protein AB0M20_11435 [Actinoplanes sp. NPDC051633]|uniref:hypothetical protein n=1 Tax=Actinoplanes sp. NPDC051633 TaxID=3155670 RepID=UPI003448BB6A
MTVETINVPVRQDAALDRGLWRRTWWRAVLVPLIVLAPLVSLAPTADHRFNLYWHGGMFRDHPAGVVTHTVTTLDTYLRLGNFRPLGRMLEKSLDLLAYTISDLFGVPVNVSFRLVSFLAAALLSVAATLFAESMVQRGPLFAGPPSKLAATVPFAVGGSFVAAGGSSPAVLFGGLYFTSAALVLAVAAVVCRISPRARHHFVLLILAGGLLACVNEIAYLALPFATAAVLARDRMRPGRRPLAALGALWLGFLPVFATVRLVIHGFCADGGCYRLSDITLGPSVLTTIPVRATAWAPPLMWRSAIHGTDGSWLGVVPVLALIALGLLAWRTRRDIPYLSIVDRRRLMALGLAAGALVLLGATLAALNAEIQRAQSWGLGWRDTAVTAAAGAILLAVAGHLLFRRTLGLVLILCLAATVTTAANKRFADRAAAAPRAILADRVAQEMAAFDPSPAGDARRCALRAEFRAEHADSAFSLRRFDQSLDVASRQLAGRPFCAR